MTTSPDSLAKGATVLVTGATGYVAGWLVKRLLQAGAHVHATVRDPSDEAKIAHLKAMAEGSEGTIRFFAADLLRDGSFEDSMQGCSVVFHTASPFLSAGKVKDPQKDLIDPALQGTATVLDSANRTESVQRVVLTSSGAAICGGPEDVSKAPGGVITEASWNTVSSLEDGAYLRSKMLAERRAWAVASAQDRWRLVVVNPGLVLGEGTADTQTSASFDWIEHLLDGTFAKGAPPLQLGMVDVRDIAEAHFRAGFLPDAEGRHIVQEGVYAVDDLADMIGPELGKGWRLPDQRSIPADAPKAKWDNSKSRTALGLTYRPLTPAVHAMVEQLLATGRLKRS